MDEVHVWRAALDLPPAIMDHLGRALVPDEQQRALCFRFERDRRHFIAARGILRTLLGRYVGQSPAAIRFTYGPQGKPVLASPDGGLRIRFNLSHARGIALFGFTRGREIGIDIEHIRPAVARAEVAERFFSPYETATLRALPATLQDLAFVTCWTRKEAYVKARGGGLSLDLGAFDVTLTPGAPAVLLQTRDEPEQRSRWTLAPIEPGPGYAGAIAIEGRGWRLHCWRYSEASRVK